MKVFGYIGLVMSMVFIGGAIALIVSPPPNVSFLAENETIRYLLAVCVLLYGLFRLYRSVRILTNKEGGGL